MLLIKYLADPNGEILQSATVLILTVSGNQKGISYTIKYLMRNCAFLSISNSDGWLIDDDLVHEPLQKLSWKVQNVPWNKPTDWDSFDLVIIRSPWDYQNHLQQFTEVLKRIEMSKAILLNSFELVMWNINKNYLFDLERKGVKLVPTIKVFALKKIDIKNAFEKFKTNQMIIKPIIGASAVDTFRVDKNDISDIKNIESVFHYRECMIQPFMNNIVDEGEYSLIYFQGKLSHTILKTVGLGDYRVQEEHGGGVTPIEEPETLLEVSGNKAMSALSETPLYARVDLVRNSQNSFALMEIELIEPGLYFRFNAESAQKFANCINDYWKNLNTAYNNA